MQLARVVPAPRPVPGSSARPPVRVVATKRAATREESLRQGRILAEYRPLVDRIVQKALGRVGFCCDADELRSAAMMGLLEAVRRYEEARGIPFVAFARHRINGAILDELRAKDRLARPSRRRAKGVEQARQKLVRKLGREPEAQELAKASGEDLETFHRRGARERAQAVVLLEDLPSSAWSDVCASPEPSALEALCTGERLGQLSAALAKLPERTRTMLSLYYQDDLSYREIGELFGVCESRICQVVKGAHKELRALLE